MSVTHLAGLVVEAEGRLRQRCAWCGAVLFEYELASVARALQPGEDPAEPWRPGTAAVNTWWRVDGHVGHAVPYEAHPDNSENALIPTDACMLLDPAVTA